MLDAVFNSMAVLLNSVKWPHRNLLLIPVTLKPQADSMFLFSPSLLVQYWTKTEFKIIENNH